MTRPVTSLRVGLVCPYSFDRPGGVQNHVLGLARALRGLGHRPAILAPGELAAGHDLPFTSAGPALPVPYNGSIARVSFGPVTSARVRRWLRDGAFDLVHLHEPVTPSIALLALRHATGPVVATYHTATPRSRTMQLAGDALRRLVEKIDAGIAVSDPARDVVVRHLGRDAVVIPNGFDHASFRPTRAQTAPAIGPWRGGNRPRITFLGRLDEPRKGLPVLVSALPAIRTAVGEVDVCLAGHGSPPYGAAGLPGVRLLGGIDEQTKRELLATTDVFVAPQVARESFGIVVLEALAAGAEVVASDLPAFADLLTAPDGRAWGRLFRRGDPSDLAAQVSAVLLDGVRHQPGAAAAVRRYDWSAVAPTVAAVYAAAAAGPGHRRRVDHIERVQRTWTALDAALVRRARRAAELTAPGVDLGRLRVHRAALAALTAAAEGSSQSHRERAESDLSRLLATAGLAVVEHDQAALARRLHNDAVAAAVRAVRSRPASSTALRAFEMAEF